MKKGLFFTLLLAIGISVSAFAAGTTYYYNPSGTGDLATYTNWWTGAGGTGTQAGAATIFTSGSNTFIILNNVSTTAAWTVSSGSIQVGRSTSSAVTLTIAANYPITGKINIPAASSGSNEVDVYSGTTPTFNTMDATSIVNYAGSVAQSVTGGTTYGTLNINNTNVGTITTTSTTGAYFNAGNTITIATAFNINSNGVFTINTSGSISVNSGATVTIYNNGTYINGTGTNAFKGAGNLTIQDGANIYLYGSNGINLSGSQNGGTAAGNGAVKVTGTVTYGTTGGNGINFYYFASQNQDVGTALPSTVNNLTIGFVSGGKTVTLTSNSSITINGTLTLANNAVLAGSGVSIALNGGAVVSSGTSALSLDATSNLSFGGSTSSIVIPSTVTSINNLTINNSSGVSLGGNLAVGGTLTLTNGALNVGSNTLTLNGATISGTATNLTTTSSSSISIGSTYAGTSIPSSVSALNNLTIGKAVSLQSALTLGGTLSLSAILTTTSTNLLTLGGTATTSAGSATAYINGPLAWQLPASASSATYLYPIGTSGLYAPFSLTNTSTTSSSSLAIVQAQVTNGATGGSAGTGVSAINTTNWWQTIVTNPSSISGGQLQFTDPSNSSATTLATSSTQGGSYAAITTSSGGNTFTSSSITPNSAYYVFAIAASLAPAVSGGGSQTITYGTAIANYQISATNSPTSYSVTYNSTDLNSAGIGLSYSTSTGIISGTPNISGTIALTIGATNSGGSTYGTYTINSSATVYYISGALNSSSSWNTAYNGSGTVAPSNLFTATNSTLNIFKNASTSGGTLSLSGNGSIINVGQVGDAITGVTLTITSGNYITGTINVYGNTLELQDATHIPTFGTLDATSTVQYDATGSETFINITYTGNLIIGNSSNAATIVAIPAITVSGNFIQYGGSTINISSAAPTFNGNFTQNSGSTLNLTTGTPNLNGATVGIYGAVSFQSTSYFYLGNTTYLTVFNGATLTISNGYGAVQNSSATGGSGLGPIRSNSSATTYPWSTYVTFQSGVNWILTTTNASPYLGNGFPSSVGNLTLNSSATNAFAVTNDGTTKGGPGNLTINGTLTLTAGKLAIGSNTLTLNGSSVAGIMANLVTTTSSNIVFGGSSTGVIFPSGATAIGGLTINNSNGVAVQSSVTLSGALTLTNGVLNTTAGTLTFASTASISGGSSSSYINGPASWTLPLSAIGTSYTFPLGTVGGGYTPLSLTSITTAASGSNPVVTAQVFNAGAAASSSVNAPLTSINTNNYWTTSVTNASVLTSASIQLTDANYGSANAIAYSSTQTGNYTYLGGAGSSGTFTSPSASSLSNYYVLAYAAVPTISSGNTATASFGATYTSSSPIYTIIASNSPTYTAVLSPSNAAISTIGLSVDPYTGKITGTPNTFGPMSISISATNGAGTASATITLNISGYLYYKGSGALDNNANWYSGNAGTGTQAPSGVFSLPNGTFEIDNTVSTVGTNSGLTISGSGSKIVLGGTASTLTVANGYPITGSISIAAGGNTLVLQDASIPTFGTLNSTSTINYAGTTSIQPITTSISYPNLIVSNSYLPTGVVTSGTYLGAYVASGSTVTISGSLTVNNGGYLFVGFSGTTTISLNSGATATINNGGSFISGQGTANTFSGAGNLTINNGANIYLYGAQGITKTGSLNSGTAATSGAFRVSGTVNYGTGINFFFFGGQAQATGTGFPSTVNNLTIGYSTANTITQTASTNVTINGTLTTLNSASYAVGANTLTLNGASSSAIKLTTTSSSTLAFTGSTSGVNIPSSVTALAGLTINNANGVTLNSNLTVTTLTLTAGNISLGSNSLTASTISAGGSNSYVVTNGTGTFTKSAITANLTLPVGTVAYYAPVQFASATSNNVTLGVKAALTNAPLIPNNVVNLQWSLSASGNYTSNITFQYNAGNVGVGYTGTNSVLGTYASTYSESAVSSVSGSGPFTVTASTVTLPNGTASLYAIGNAFSFANAVPGAPASITATADDALAFIAYSTPVINTGSSVIDYTITAIPSSGSNIVRTGITANPYTFTGLTNGTTYTFTIAARNIVGTGATISSVATTPSATTIWNGITWSAGEPDASQNAIIAANLSTNTFSAVTNFTVNSGVKFTLTAPLSVKGLLVNNGIITGSGTLTLASTVAQTISGSGTVGNITLNNSNGVFVASGSNSLGITGVLTLQSGLLTTNGNLTFKSTSIANTGTFAPYGAAGNTGTIFGTLTVERYIPAGYRGYRDLASGLYGVGTIYNNWQEGGSLTSGKGIFITGTSATDANKANYASGQPAPNSNGLDFSLNGINSAYTYKSSTFTAITNTKVNLDPFAGYRVLVRGDRSFNLATTPIANVYGYGLLMVNPTVLRSVGGKLITGTVTYDKTGASGTTYDGISITSSASALNDTVGKFNLVANPYVAPVQWGTGTAMNDASTTVYGASSNVNGSYWYLDPTYAATGRYIAFNALTGSSVVRTNGSGDTSYKSATSLGYIQPNQAVFVQTFAASPTVVFKETAKAVNATKTSIFGVTVPLSKIYISLNKINPSTNNYYRVDGAAIAFSANFANATYGPQDALKFEGASDNLFVTDKGKNLSIDGRLPASSTDLLPIVIAKPTAKNYQLVVDASNYTLNGYAPVLKDNYKGTAKALSASVDTISFTIDSAIEASYNRRFSIAFKPTTLAVNGIVASATLNNRIATISWNTIGEKGVSRFEIEKSSDAKNFTKLSEATAKNTASASYSTTDNSVTATTYYRVKAISELGAISFSNVAKLLITNHDLGITLYPNPIIAGKTLNVSLNNVAAGKYSVAITNVLGQPVQEAAINHAGSSASHSITVNGALAAGTYNVSIRNANNQIVYQSKLSVQ